MPICTGSTAPRKWRIWRLAELAEFDGIVLVEWGEVVETTFGEHLVVHLEHDDERDDDTG